jgi:hypothetical protein
VEEEWLLLPPQTAMQTAAPTAAALTATINPVLGTHAAAVSVPAVPPGGTGP